MAPLTSPLQGLALLLTGGRKRGVEMDLADWPRMAIVYLLAVLSSLVKPRWVPQRHFPLLEVRLQRATPPDPSRVSAWRALVGWAKPAPSPGAAAPKTATAAAAMTPQAADAATPLPALFFMAQAFRLVMSLLTLPAFPTAIMGTVVNKRARYALLRPVLPSEGVAYAARLDPATRQTPGGHGELDVHVEARALTGGSNGGGGGGHGGDGGGELVFAAVLTLVLMNPKPRRRDPGAAAPAAKAADDPLLSDAPPIASWRFAADVGRRYALIDGDVSPMHLSALTARLSGFPSPVANVHLVAARAERELAAAVDEIGGSAGGDVDAAAVAASASLLQPLPAPYALELEFKRPTLLPNTLNLAPSTPAGARGGKAAILAAAAADAGGYGFRVADGKGRPVAVGALRCGARAVQAAMQTW
jgi:acyl dehydratase